MKSSVVKPKTPLTKNQQAERLVRSDHMTAQALQRQFDTAMCAKGISMKLYEAATGALQTLEAGIRAKKYDDADLQILRALYLMDRGQVHIDASRFNVQMTGSCLLQAIEQFDLDHAGIMAFVTRERNRFRDLNELETIVTRVFVYTSYAYARAMGNHGNTLPVIKKLLAGGENRWCITEAQQMLQDNRHFSKKVYDGEILGYLSKKTTPTDDGSGDVLRHIMAW